ncbi:MAG: type I-B CRISPR-associated protein Cas7/Cst2/DevR [Clostridiales bacterium]|nr:type I-B CRISPR-associated protein Cas7/Cst2/DevR [Clostridiales bacterium]
MEIMGLTMAIIFQIESPDDEKTSENIKSRRRIIDGKLYRHTYIPIQTLRHNLINQIGMDHEEIGTDKTALQLDPKATIDKYPEIDLFGYVKKAEEQKIRLAIVRLSNAVSLESLEGEDGIKRTYYTYTISADLDKVGTDENDDIEIENTEKKDRVINLLDTIRHLHMDVNEEEKELEPLFVIGGVYDFEDAIFHDILGVENNKVDIDKIRNVLKNVPYENVELDTHCGLAKGFFDNDNEIIEKLGAKSISEYFEIIKDKVINYYKDN